MALVPSTRWTVKDVLSTVRELSKTVDQKKVLVDQGRYFYNAAISEIVTLLNGASDPSYFRAEVITPTADLNLYTQTMIIGISASASTITRFSGAWDLGETLFMSVIDHTTHAKTMEAVGRITALDATNKVATLSVIYGTLVDYAGGGADYPNVWSIDTMSTLTVELDTLTYPVDKIVTIADATYGQCIPVTLDEYYSIGRSDFGHKSYDNDIIWTQTGEKIYFRYGSKISAPGTKTIIYQRQPVYPTLYDDTEYVDLADKWVPLLCKRIYTFLVLQTENDIPKNLAQEMQLDYQQISAFAASEISNKLRSVSPRDRQQQ